MLFFKNSYLGWDVAPQTLPKTISELEVPTVAVQERERRYSPPPGVLHITLVDPPEVRRLVELTGRLDVADVGLFLKAKFRHIKQQFVTDARVHVWGFEREGKRVKAWVLLVRWPAVERIRKSLSLDHKQLHITIGLQEDRTAEE